jgi:hypothetical protein
MIQGLKIHSGIWAAVAVFALAGLASAAPQVPQQPSPGVIDQIVHDRGNIVTTVQNFGYIGGYSWAGRPSGRWPANTNHNYLAEMKFWVGGITPTGDTLLANTEDDFNPIPSYIAGSLTNDIRLSTDPSRYDYTPTDTIGAGLGFPAYGWRVWDAALNDWVYNQVYSFRDSTFFNGGPLGVQESICRFADDALGHSLMGLEITQTIHQWDYDYNRDIIFFTLEVKNAGTEDLTSVVLGVYCDFDVGGMDPASGENGRLGDLVASDTVLDLAWTYDEDGYDPGWGPDVVAGLMGTVILSTPGDVGMTSFNTGQWEFLPHNDEERYAMVDNTEFDESLPPTDQYYVQGVRGIDLPVGETVRIDFALVAAPNEEYLKETAKRAKALLEKHFISPRPPDRPVTTVTAGDGAVKLYWDNTAENSIEPTTGEQDFRGYKIYRSADRGATWGTLVTNPDYSTGPNYYPIARFEKDPLGRIGHTFVDSNVTNGLDYWYSVCAYDTGAPDLNIGQLENSRLNPNSAANTIAVTPRDDPLGYITPQASIAHTYTGNWEPCTDAVSLNVVDEGQLTGDDYQVVFTENCVENFWYLINVTTGDTLLRDQTQWDGVYNAYPVVDGIQIVVKNPGRLADAVYQSAFSVPGETTVVPLFMEQFAPDMGCNANFRNDVEIRFTETGSTWYEWFTGNPITVPFEVWNLTENLQLGGWIADWGGEGEWTPADQDYIILTNYDYDNGNFHPEVLPDYLTWITAIDPTVLPQTGDVLTIEGPKIVSPEDAFAFSSGKIAAELASRNLNQVRVVPNPYVGYAKWDGDGGRRKLQFVNLPDECVIRIYTLAGELIRTLPHESGTGSEDWDMLSEAGRGVASGVYLFNVDSQYGNRTGKFAVIK